jgi:hypothetical protein
MHARRTRARALQLLADGRSVSSVAHEVGVSRAAVREWQSRGLDPDGRDQCPAEAPDRLVTLAYSALLGYYLGDGCVSRLGRTYSLRVTCDAVYPGIIEDVAGLVTAVRGRGPVTRVSAPGCIVVCGYWNHWPCLFPQHGPGRKHERTLTLEPWQQQVVDTHPAAFLRGLFHSDGCRVDNWATRQVAGETKRYDYGRWQFVNHSTDIQGFCTDALDRLGIPWRRSSWKTISVSRREAVARLDELIGPKL